MKTGNHKRGLIVHRRWAQTALLIYVIGFFLLGLMTYQTYRGQPPVPRQVVTTNGRVLFTGDDIRAGQHVFFRHGLMQYGSIFGHGGYLGPDFTADYLRRAAEHVIRFHGGNGLAEAREQTIQDFKINRYDPSSGQLVFTDAQVDAFESLQAHYRAYFSDPTTSKGLKPSAITNPTELRQLTAFFAWSAWTASTTRPGKDYSYTNNWPPEPRVDNHPTGAMVVWSILSLIALLGGIGLLLAAFGRWEFLGWHGAQERRVEFRRPRDVALSPSQTTCAWFFLVMALLFLFQSLLGGATQHYRAELTSFFGFDLARWLPFNLARTWHVQLAIFWVATSFLATGIFVGQMIAGKPEPRGQRWLARILLAALAVVVVGSLAGEAAGIHGLATSDWYGNQGLEYLDLGRLWQALLSLGLLLWAIMLLRVLWPRMKTEHVGNLPWLLFFSALALPAFYAVGLLSSQTETFTVSDFWRFWVVHLWVEDFLELFTTIMVAYMFVLVGVVREKEALIVVYLDIILYSIGGVVGTLHHAYFSGGPVEDMALGAFFSAAEVIPLTFLTLEAWSFLHLGLHQRKHTSTPFPHRWPVMFLIAVGFWNFLGAGIFGFLINLPIVSYYQIGTALTSNHGHAAMMGVYGMLAVGLALFALRYLTQEEHWSDRLAKISFWSLNLGLGWMVLVTLFPVGILQLYESVSKGYFEARQLQFFTQRAHSMLEWLRLPGDALFIIGGIVPLVIICWRGVRYPAIRKAHEQAESTLFTEVDVPEEEPPQS